MTNKKRFYERQLVSNGKYHLGSPEKQTESKQLGCIELSFNVKS